MILRVERVIRNLGLQQGITYFWCPYCGAEWLRGGHKEGFVKSAASNHVGACKEIVLFQLGYVMGPRWGTVIPLKDAEQLSHWKRWRRQILGLIASRKRAGRTPRKPK
jgi:hypothetical protein